MNQINTSTNELISIQTASAKYKIHRNTLLNWCKSGIIKPKLRIKHNKFLFSEIELLPILEVRGFLFDKEIGA